LTKGHRKEEEIKGRAVNREWKEDKQRKETREYNRLNRKWTRRGERREEDIRDGWDRKDKGQEQGGEERERENRKKG
jgi:hypothetical protein